MEFDHFMLLSILQMTEFHDYYGSISRYRLYELIKRIPKVLVSYMWPHLKELDIASLSPVVSLLETTENKKSKWRKRHQSGQRKVSVAPQHRRRVSIDIKILFYELRP